MRIQAAEVACLLRTFNEPSDGAALKSRELTLLLLDGSPAPFSRDHFAPGHVTCTGMVLHPSTDAILTVHHRRLNRWLLPGGHVEPGDTSIDEAARREVLEETGVECEPQSPPVLAGIDVHGIPARGSEPYHLHHDLLFFFRGRSPEIRVNQEVRAAEWRDPSQFHAVQIASNIQLAYARMRELFSYR